MSIKTTKYTVAILIFVFVLLLLAPNVFAQEVQYESLFSDNEIVFEKGLGPFLNQLFRIGLTVAAILAVLFIAIGGFQYMTTDAVSGQTEGRQKIQNATLGLLLALIIFIILNTINPKLLELNPNITPAPTSNNPNFIDKFFQGIKGGDVLETPQKQLDAAEQKLADSIGAKRTDPGWLNDADTKSLGREINRLKGKINRTNREALIKDDLFNTNASGSSLTPEQEDIRSDDATNIRGRDEQNFNDAANTQLE